MKKQVLIRGVDEATYRKAKSAAALRGVSMGVAVSDALRSWVAEGRADEAQGEAEQDRNYVRTHWHELERHRGKAVVVSGGKVQGVFATYGEARVLAARFKVALTFVVDQPPATRVIELGPDLELQR